MLLSQVKVVRQGEPLNSGRSDFVFRAGLQLIA